MRLGKKRGRAGVGVEHGTWVLSNHWGGSIKKEKCEERETRSAPRLTRGHVRARPWQFAPSPPRPVFLHGSVTRKILSMEGSLIQLLWLKINSGDQMLKCSTFTHLFSKQLLSAPSEDSEDQQVWSTGSWQRKQGKPGWQQYWSLWRALKCLLDKDVSLIWSWLTFEKHCPEQGQEAGNSPTPLRTAVGLLWWGRLLLNVLIKQNYLLHLERSKKTPSHTVASKQGTTT